MDRVIDIKVGGNHLTKDGKVAGVVGEGNVTNLRISFDDGWNGYAKTVTFFDALGGNPVKRLLTVDLMENVAESTEIYLVPIPAEPLAVVGTMSFVIDGYIDGKRQRSIEGKLEVKYAPNTDNAGEPIDPTPDQIEQMQGQYEAVMGKIQDAYVHRNEAEAFAGDAKASKEQAEGFANFAGGQAQNAMNAYADASREAQKAKESAEDAEESATKAENALGKTNYIGANGNWYAWDSIKNEFYDTGVRAQSGSVVYFGDNPPADADVWIDPNGESALYAPYIGDNGNWYVFDPETQTFVDSGVFAKAYTPIKGEDYYTAEEKAEMFDYMNALFSTFSPTRAFVNLLGGSKNWVAENVTDSSGRVIGSRYGQVVNVNNAVITPNSKVDLQLSSEQMVIFYEKDLAFVAENDNGVVTIYCIGNIPENNYTIQATVTEVAING